MDTALSKLHNHLALAIRLMLSGEPEQVAKGREVLTLFLNKFPESKPIDNTKNPDGLVWWPSMVPQKPGDDPRAFQPQPVEGWVCFHCKERYDTYELAYAHFATEPNNTPFCLVTPRDLTLAAELRKVRLERNYLDGMLDAIKIIETKMINKKE